jgi:hypothetical protein
MATYADVVDASGVDGQILLMMRRMISAANPITAGAVTTTTSVGTPMKSIAGE